MKKNSIYFTIFVLITMLLNSQTHTDNWLTINTKYSDMSGVISVPAKDTVFIHRMDGSLLRSFNGGASWDSVFIRHDSTRFTDIGSYFLNGKIGFTWGIWGCMYTGIKQERPVLLKTTNSGSTWQPIMNGLEEDFVNVSLVHFWDKDNGIVVGTCPGTHHSNHIYLTFNGGNTWTQSMYPYYPSITFSPKMASFPDKYNGVMAGNSFDFNFTTTDNGGYEWKNNEVHKFNYSATGIKSFGFQNGFVLANDSVYLTEDNFRTLSRKKLPFSNYNNSILNNNASFYSYDNNTAYFLTFNDHLYKTTDGFKTYSISKVKNNMPNYSMAGYDNDVYVYAVNGIVYKTKIGNDDQTKDVVDHSDFLIYPNPVSGDVVNYKSSKKAASYTISNILGIIIEQHNSTDLPTINIANLKPSSYIIAFYGENNELLATKKIIKISGKQ